MVRTADSPQRARAARALRVLLATAAGVKLASLVPSFVPGPTSSALRSPRSSVAQVARRAEAPIGDDGGFMKFLKVEQEIELSEEEYKIALEAEVEAQRKRYYIGGEVKENNLVVPWRPVDEKQLEADARRQLKKNGIYDPMGPDPVKEAADKSKDSLIDLQIIGEQDVRIEWTAGQPGTKVGYIVERKRQQDSNFQEIGTYENQASAFLLIKTYTGHEYSYTDQIVKPGPYTYRVLCRFRSGDITVVDQKDITVPELEGVDNLAALGLLLFVFVVSVIGAYIYDPIVT